MSSIGRELVDKLIEFIRRLSGVNWYVLLDSKSGEVIDHSPIVSMDEAKELSELLTRSRRVLEDLSKYTLFRRKEEFAHNMYFRFDEEVLDIETLGDYIMALNIANKLVPVLSRFFDKIRKGEHVKCAHCGADLTFETLTCPRCGRTIPFISEKCPHCGYDLSIRRCPKCGKVITYEGGIVRGSPEAFGIGILMGILVLAFTAFMAPPNPLYKWIFYGIGGAFAAVFSLLGYFMSKPR